MLSELQIEKNKQEFISILRRVNRQGVEKLIEWLEDSLNCDFFVAPSSSVYHGNYKGGLCEHSLNVYRCLLKLRDMYTALMTEKGKEIVKITDEQIIVTALLHDLCKICYYTEKKLFIKDDQGMWQSYMGYTIDDRFPLGHGEKSIFFIQRFFPLSGVEALAIRWHMGYEQNGLHIDSRERKSLEAAWNLAPLAYLLHQADSMSAFLLEDMIDNKKAFTNT